jgi:hypothetical protein
MRSEPFAFAPWMRSIERRLLRIERRGPGDSGGGGGGAIDWASIWKGDWNSATTYVEGDMVQRSGTVYVATTTSLNVDPAAGAIELVLVSPLAGTWGMDGEIDHVQSFQLTSPAHLSNVVIVEAFGVTPGIVYTVKVYSDPSGLPVLSTGTTTSTGVDQAQHTVALSADLLASTPYYVRVTAPTGGYRRAAGGGSYVPGGTLRDPAFTMHLVVPGVSDRTDRGLLMQINGVADPAWLELWS